jgi:hypothetical protein
MNYFGTLNHLQNEGIIQVYNLHAVYGIFINGTCICYGNCHISGKQPGDSGCKGYDLQFTLVRAFMGIVSIEPYK